MLTLCNSRHCRLQFSLQFLITVIIMNLGKCVAMFITLYRQKDRTLVTVGDALASFLDKPSSLTQGRCLMAKADVNRGPMQWQLPETTDTPNILRLRVSFRKVISRRSRGTPGRPNTQPVPITYRGPLPRRWFAAASMKRWCITIGLCAVAVATGVALLARGITSITPNLGSGETPFSLGIGAVDPRAMVTTNLPSDGVRGLLCAVLLANCPQAIVSFLYLAYNGLLTSMMLTHEYTKYGVNGRRKPLRVTTPRGQQREQS